MTDDAERWLPIPWAPDYEISDCANVRTTRRPGNHCQPRLTEPRLIATTRVLRGQRYAYLPCPDGKYRLRNVRKIMDAVFNAEEQA
jgi:hypothetical protein